jgi:hypothetical protein
MQLRFATNLSAEEYVKQKAWTQAKLHSCPLHPQGGCSLAKHGTYPRKFPPGTKVARWNCPEGCTTISLLPDCLAARFPGTLIDVEMVLIKVQESPSQEAAADMIRKDIQLPGALRWIRRRIFLVTAALTMIMGMLPNLPKDCMPTFSCFQDFLDYKSVLPALRGYAQEHLNELPHPIGFGSYPKKRIQHKMGTDPP